MDVRGVGSSTGINPISLSPATGPKVPAQVSKPVGPQDEVQISSAGRLMEQLGQVSSIRQERIEQIRQAIADGTYDTDEKLEAALLKMMASIQSSGSDESR